MNLFPNTVVTFTALPSEQHNLPRTIVVKTDDEGDVTTHLHILEFDHTAPEQVEYVARINERVTWRCTPHDQRA